MPCYDPGLERELAEKQIQRLENFEAAICGIMTTLEAMDLTDQILGAVDWEESGVTRDWVTNWWIEHKKHDLVRVNREKNLRDKEIALKKLSKRERQLLGLV